MAVSDVDRVFVQETHGTPAVAALSARLKAGGRNAVWRVHRRPPLWWVEEQTGALAMHRRAVFWLDGGWQVLTGLSAFRQLLATCVPTVGVEDIEAVAAVAGGMLDAEPLLTREAVDDLRDPRWHVLPKSADDVAAWEPPHIAGRTLVFVVLRQRGLERVAIDLDTFSVDSTPC